MLLAIDFDGVLHDKLNPVYGKRMGPPLPGAVEAMERLFQGGCKLVVFTVMATTPSGQEAVQNWLDYYNISYHLVTAIKPNADYFIDDKAIKHTSWEDTFKQIGSTF